MKYAVRTFDGRNFDTPNAAEYVAIISPSSDDTGEYTATYGDFNTAHTHLFLNLDRVHSISISEVPDDAAESEQQSS